jgi:hypothetical protein
MVAVGLSCGGCLSCGDCVIEGDNFNRADNSDINSGAPFTWSGDTGDAIISSNEMVILAGTTARYTCPTGHSESSGIVAAKFSADTGDECEVWLNGSDADNCTVARVTVGASGTLEIIERSGGSDTVIESVSSATSAFDQFTITLYYDETTGTAKAVTDAADLCAFLIDPVGDLYGVSLGANAGLIYVDDFTFTQLGDGENGCPELEDCPYDPCFQTIESGWEGVLEISGVANDVCTGCAFLNDTFILPLTSNGSTEKVFQLFEFTEASLCGTTDWEITLWIEVTCLAVDSFRIEVFIQIVKFGVTEQGVWQYTFSTPPPNLFEIYPSSLFSTVAISGAGNWCDLTGVSFTVSFNPP